VRKVRFQLKGKGKSGGARVIYIDFAVDQHTYLITAFAKNEQVNLTGTQKNEIKAFVKSL
jgi:hypothetical protein